ncbi:MAG TPA: ABC transporter ATP-binding protein [Candidatus Saccharimonadales bacterium]|nr:ABC transporter ATP-binding protein [Candidatus Saccharimonadales bacterium]
MKSMSLTRDTLRLFWRHANTYPKYTWSLLIGTPLTVLVYQFIPPLILARVMGRLSKGNYIKHDLWHSFGPELVWYTILMFLGGAVAWRLIVMTIWKLESRVNRDLNERIFKHLLLQSASFHANTFGGSLVSQATKLTGAYVRMADTIVFQMLPLVSSLVFTMVILAPSAPQFVLGLVGFAAFYIVSTLLATEKIRRLNIVENEAHSKQIGYLADDITNVMAVKSFAGSGFEEKVFHEKSEDMRRATLRLMRHVAKRDAYFSSITTAISALSLTMAAAGVVIFNADIATVFLILTYTANISQQLWNFSGSTMRNFNRSIGDASDMVKVLQQRPEVLDPAKPEEMLVKNGMIAFENVIFTHDGADGALFNGLNLTIAPGEKIGLVGHSGSGKTTLTRILLRFSDIDGGAINIDGQNIAHVTQDDLRRHIAYVPQEPLLFHRSIKENIAYGRPGATDEEIFAAARQANAAEFIEGLQDGYSTLVGERGVKLSGGQRQRIVIARAILKDAPILVLDEATSALDSESEVLIQQALQKLMQNRTTIVIAHRLSTIQKMDRIIVLARGKITEQGSHEQLLAKKGTYAQLWAHQSGGFIEE